MNLRSKWLGALISLLVIVSMALISFVPITRAAAPAKHVQKHAHKGKKKTSTKRNKPVGQIIYSDDQFPDTLNPAQAGLVVDVETTDSMFDSLFLFNNKAQFKPEMATNIPTVKNHEVLNGGREYIVHLKKGLKWSNNTAVTSKDIVFGWHIGMNKASGPICQGSCDVISRIDTPNATTAVFHLSRPSAAFLSNDLPPMWPSSWPQAWSGDAAAAAAKLYTDTSFNFENTSYPTNGPYQVSSYSNNDRIVLTPMKYYNDMTHGGYLKKLIFSFYANPAAMIAAAASNATDVTQDYTADELHQLNASSHGRYKVHADPGLSIEHLELNQDATYNGKPNPLHSATVRDALALAVDKSGVIRSALALPANQVKSVEAWTFLLDTPKLVQIYADKSLQGQWDPIRHKFLATTGTGVALADAKKLLSHTQWKSGFTLDWFTTPIPARAASEAVIANNWSRLGVKVNFQTQPASKLFGTWQTGGTLAHGTFQISEFAYSQNTPDPDGWKYNFQSKYIDRRATVHTLVNSNDAGVVDALLNREFNIGNKAMSKSVRANAYKKIQVEVNKTADWIPLYFRPSIVTNDSHVANFSNNPTATGPEWDTYAWRYKS